MAISESLVQDIHDKASLASTSSSTPSRVHITGVRNGSHEDLEGAVLEKETLSSTTAGVNRVITALDWTGPDDPENPENWSGWKKAYHIAYVGLQGFAITFASSVYTPASNGVAEHFHVSLEAATLPLTVYVLGLGLGPTISAPLSEVYGRKIVYMTLFPISLLFTLGAGCAQNFATLLVCRFLAGVIGSGGLAIGAGSTSDLTPPIKRARVAGVFLLAPFAGPAFGPPVGGFVAQFKTWRWSQWTILMVGLFVVIVGLPQSETYKKIILQQRAKRLGLPPPPNPMASMSVKQKIRFIVMLTISRPIMMLLTEPIVTFLGIYTAFNFGVLFAFFAAFPLIFSSTHPEIQVYHFTIGETGLVYLSISIGLAIASAVFAVYDHWIYMPRATAEITKNGKDPRSLLLPPEWRTQPAMIGCVFLPLGLFWFAWTARADIHWSVPVVACIFFGAGNLLIFFTAVLYQVDTFGPTMGASAMAANGILRYTAGAVFPLFARQMYRTMGVGWATSLLGFVTVALMPLPFVLWKFGVQMRARSRYTPKLT